MANERTQPSYQLLLGARGGLGPVHVSVEAFFEFSFWLAEELEDLVRTSAQKLPNFPSKQVFGFVPPALQRGPQP